MAALTPPYYEKIDWVKAMNTPAPVAMFTPWDFTEKWPQIVVYDRLHRTPMFVDRDQCYWSLGKGPSDCVWMIGWDGR